MSLVDAVPITWVDVARRLAASGIDVPKPPPEVVRTRASWFGLTVECSGPVSEDAIANWLESVFPRRISRSPLSLELDGPASQLHIDLEIVARRATHRPAFGIVDGVVDYFYVPDVVSVRPVPVVACLSVKGGTGRTTSAIAFSAAWARKSGRRVLLVDADIEAPGITYLFESVAGSPRVSLEDIIVLAHGAESAEAEDVVEFAAARLRDQSLSDEITVLPLRRDADELASPSIRAEHLSTENNPFALADLLSRIAAKLECSGVVIDVRAGLVPLGVNLALDPDVSPIFVTTLSSQSIRATAALTSFLAREVRRAGRTPRKPLLVVNRVPSVFRQSGMDAQIVGPLVEKMIDSLVEDAEAGSGLSDSIDDVEPLNQVSVPELPDIQVMSGRWDEFTAQLKTSGFAAATNSVFDSWIASELEQGKVSGVTLCDDTPNFVSSEAQRKLQHFASQLIAAESIQGSVPKPLVINALSSLVRRFQSDVPIAICEGAKGTGKTMAARYFTSQVTWRQACFSLGEIEDAADAVLIPVVASLQVSPSVQDEFAAARSAAADSLGFFAPQEFYRTVTFLKQRLAENINEAAWVDCWLDVAAWGVGFEAGAQGAGARFIEALRGRKLRAVLIFEGLEELYLSAQDPGVDVAMRALLVSLPQRLRSEAGRPLGAIIFARRDTIDAAIRQNVDQFRREYSAFALSWTEDDVLELAAWISTLSGALLGLWDKNFSALPNEEKKERLELLWGRKLGPDDQPGKRTKEAYTAAWVVAVLSDLRGRLVPRDLVRLLATAAAIEPNDDERATFPTRLLIPRSIRGAIESTSEKKVAETKEEIPELKPIFEKFQSRADEIAVPLTEKALQILAITSDEVKTLSRHGVVFEDGNMLEVPELFRRGLRLRHGGARRSVVNLHWRAKQRAGDV
jgi:MinD-like ATPase involved in chromosome partitioning or flagellar assembly